MHNNWAGCALRLNNTCIVLLVREKGIFRIIIEKLKFICKKL
jgi:hypothetical protein